MKIGIYGGTFDPIHRGHITAAQAAAQQLGLVRIYHQYSVNSYVID